MTTIESKGWRLVFRASGEPVPRWHDTGEHVIVDGTPPHKPASAGFVITADGAEYYAHVAGMCWVHPDLRPCIV